MADENTAPDEEKVALTANESEKEAVDGVAVVVDPGYDDHDTSKTKFINGGADATVTIEDPASNVEFVGLTKEELMKYSNDPYWVKVRWVLLIGFWVLWFAMLVAAVIIIVLAPKCPPRPDLEWYQKAVGYQVIPATFKDSDGDGQGDLNGIASSLDYLRNTLNVTALLVAPMFKSPMQDLGYDVTNYMELDEPYGTMADFDSLRVAMHKKGMKLILDFSPQQTSLENAWFQNSKKDKTNEHANFYTWQDAAGTEESVYGGPAWTQDTTRNQFYYHHYSKQQPRLNLAEENVQKEMSKVLKFWLDKNVDGFHIGDVDSLTVDMKTSGEVMNKWRSQLDAYTEEHGYKVLMGSVTSPLTNNSALFEVDGKKVLDLVVSSSLKELDNVCDGTCVSSLVGDWVDAMPKGRWASWMVGAPNVKRVSSRVGSDRVNAVNMLLLTLPGTPISYYGEEIGMTSHQVPFESAKDLVMKKDAAYYGNHTRDGERTPMQWNVDANAGFTTSDQPWLPVNPDYATRNVKTQTAHGVGVSELEIYTQISLLRQEPSFQWGDFEAIKVPGSATFAYLRQAEGFSGYLVALNFGSAPDTVNFHKAMPKKIPMQGKVAANTANFQDIGHARDFAIGNSLSLDNIHLREGEGLVFEFPWSAVQELTKDDE